MVDKVTVSLAQGAIAPASQWVYVWRTDDSARRIFYVGATTLPIEVRTWLHATSDDPNIGRIKASHSDALDGVVTVTGYRVPSGVDRQAVKAYVSAAVGLSDHVSVDERSSIAGREIVADLRLPPAS